MLIKKIFQTMLVGGFMLALGACSAPGNGHKGQDAGAYDADSSAEASGAGDASSYGDEANPKSLFAKRTYYFDFNRSNVREEYKPAIFANADYLVAHRNAHIVVEGHTDPRGSREYNVALAEHRAIAVADLLKAKGVSPSQIRVVSYGAERLAAPGHSEDDYQLDRRAVVVYLKK